MHPDLSVVCLPLRAQWGDGSTGARHNSLMGPGGDTCWRLPLRLRSLVATTSPALNKPQPRPDGRADRAGGERYARLRHSEARLPDLSEGPGLCGPRSPPPTRARRFRRCVYRLPPLPRREASPPDDNGLDLAAPTRPFATAFAPMQSRPRRRSRRSLLPSSGAVSLGVASLFRSAVRLWRRCERFLSPRLPNDRARTQRSKTWRRG